METETLGIQLCLTGFFYYEQTQALNWDKYCSKLGMIKGRKTPGTGQLEDRTSPRRNGTNSHSLTGKSDNRCCIHLTFYPRITTYIYSLNEKKLNILEACKNCRDQFTIQQLRMFWRMESCRRPKDSEC